MMGRTANMLFGNARQMGDAPFDGKTYGRKNKTWVEVVGGGGEAYDWNIHSPEQIIGDLDEPVNVIATIDGTGAVDETIPAGTYSIVAVNAAGETLPVDVPEMVILVDTTSVLVSWDAITGATGYRVYEVATGLYFDLVSNNWDYLTETPATAGTLPVENTAYIYQSPFTIENGDTVEFKGEGIDVETEVTGSVKSVLLKATHKTPVTIHPDSAAYASIDGNQVLTINEQTGGSSVTQITGLTLVVANWVSDGALYKYVLSDAAITATSSVEVIPANASYDVLVVAEPMPETESASGTVTMWVKNVPSADVNVTINITEVV